MDVTTGLIEASKRFYTARLSGLMALLSVAASPAQSPTEVQPDGSLP